jgi:hypothetical protein
LFIGRFKEIAHMQSILRCEQFCARRAREIAGGGEVGGLFMQGSGAFLTEPLMMVAGVVAGSPVILLDEPGVVHGTKLADQDGFGFLVQFGGECHGSETMSIASGPVPNNRHCRVVFISDGQVFYFNQLR